MYIAVSVHLLLDRRLRQNKLHIKQPQHRIDHDNAELDPHCIFNTKQKICVVLKITRNIGCCIYFHKSKKFGKLSSHLASHMSSHVNFESCLVGWKRYLRIYRDQDISQTSFLWLILWKLTGLNFDGFNRCLSLQNRFSPIKWWLILCCNVRNLDKGFIFVDWWAIKLLAYTYFYLEVYVRK